jgi:hypothetical protein
MGGELMNDKATIAKLKLDLHVAQMQVQALEVAVDFLKDPNASPYAHLAVLRNVDLSLVLRSR